MKITNISSVLFALLITLTSYAQQISPTELAESFKNPPPSAKPRTWMHAMSGNMSKEGLTKDLEAMADVGIGGIILFNVSHFIPKGNVKFNSPEHIEMIAHAAAECERLGLSFGIHNCDGWTSSGGPWVTPEHSMKQVVYSETIVKGGKVKTKLETPTRRGDYYTDIAVLAYPALDSEIIDSKVKPKLLSSNADFDLVVISDKKIDKRTELKVEDKNAWVQFDYGQPFTLRSIYANFEKAIAARGKVFLKTSNDGVNFKTEQELNLLRMGKREHGIDMNFDGITARYFRIESEISLDLSEINLSSTYRFDNMLARTSLYKVENNRMPEIDASKKSMIVNKENIINLSASMDADGNLIADLPKGNWTVMRFGYTIMGAVNSPASSEGTGWEVDKMSRESFKTFYDGYVTNVIKASKPVAPNALQYIEIDSYEVGGQNWTKDYPKYFKEQLGYDILDYLPLYAGRYINDAETTERILWDVRNFNSKLMTDNYFDYFTELCHADGLISYVEPYSFNAGFNELDATRKVDIPMGEFWMHQRYQTETAVSGARIYGKNIVSAESFSAQSEINWKGHPGTLKLTGDKAWTYGINEFMFHRFAHQANTHVQPGMTMSQWGSHIDRTQTWWDNAGKAWFKYLARGQFLLRQGIPVSDLLVFVGDGSPNSIVTRSSIIPNLPNSINFDCINADALINRITVKDKKLTLPNGIQYHALYLTNVKEMQLSTLSKIADLANQGAIIIGDKPSEIGGFSASEADKTKFDSLVKSTWSKASTHLKVVWNDLYAQNNIPIDLKIEEGEDITYIHRKTGNKDIYFFFNPDSIERTYICTFNVDGKIPEIWNQMTGEIKKLGSFEHINGQTNVAITLPAEGSSFIVFSESSKGIKTIQPISAAKQTALHIALTANKQTRIEVSENGRYDLKRTNGKNEQLVVQDIPEPITINNSWEVTFPDIKSGSKTLTFPLLLDWTEHENEEIKYYSGTAYYATTFDMKEDFTANNRRFTLDLGTVNVAARIMLNGKDMGVLWMKPHTLDITNALVKGKNTLKIEVTNLWTNRLIGDENFANETGYNVRMDEMPEWYTDNKVPNLGERSSFCAYPFYQKGDPLLPSGLLGPVKIRISKIITR